MDNFCSRDDIRMHTFGFSHRTSEVTLRDLLDGKPTRTAGAKRRGADAARQPVSAGTSGRRQTALAALRHRADQDAATRMRWNAISAWSLTSLLHPAWRSFSGGAADRYWRGSTGSLWVRTVPLDLLDALPAVK